MNPVVSRRHARFLIMLMTPYQLDSKWFSYPVTRSSVVPLAPISQNPILETSSDTFQYPGCVESNVFWRLISWGYRPYQPQLGWIQEANCMDHHIFGLLSYTIYLHGCSCWWECRATGRIDSTQLVAKLFVRSIKYFMEQHNSVRTVLSLISRVFGANMKRS